jgi:hypothetical protein
MMLWQFMVSGLVRLPGTHTSSCISTIKRRGDGMEIEEIANELLEVKEMLEVLKEKYSIPELDPLWLDPKEKITWILEEIE